MGVRRQCNRYTTQPWGKDEADVIRRAKRYFNYFPFAFIIVKRSDLFFANPPALPPFKDPEGARLYKKVDGRWREINK